MQLNFAITYEADRRQFTDETNKLFDHPILHKRIDEIKGARAFIIWFKLVSRRHTVLKGDIYEWVEFVKKSIKRGENSPDIYEINPLGFLYMYTDWAIAEGATHNFESALKILKSLWEKIKVPPPGIPKGGLEDAKLFIHTLEMNFLRKLGRDTEVLEIAEKINLPVSTTSDYNHVMLAFEHAVALLQCGQMSLAMDKLNFLLQGDTDMRANIQPYLRPMMVIIQLDLGNYQTVPYLIKSARQWMKRYKKSSIEAETFFSLAYSIAAAPSTQQRKRWLALKEAVDEGKLSDLDREINMKSWLNRKLRIVQ